MPAATRTEASGETPFTVEKYETVRDVYEALYRGEIDEQRVAELLVALNRRNFSWPVRALSSLSPRR